MVKTVHMSMYFGRGNNNQVIFATDALVSSLMQVMNLEDCDVYSYVPDAEADPFANVGSM